MGSGTNSSEIYCGHAARFFVFLFTAGGIACSVMASLNCEFFTFTMKDPSVLPEPFTDQESGSVGLFGTFNAKGKCATYQEQFIQLVTVWDYNPMFPAGQMAAIVGPSCAAIACFFNMLEWCCCSHAVSYVTAFFALFFAFSCQGLTFLIYGQREFCFSGESSGCQLGLGAYLSIAATAAFYLASVLWCCMPRLDPAYKRRHKHPADDRSDPHGASFADDGKSMGIVETDTQAPPPWESNGYNNSNAAGTPPMGSGSWTEVERSENAYAKSGGGSFQDEVHDDIEDQQQAPPVNQSFGSSHSGSYEDPPATYEHMPSTRQEPPASYRPMASYQQPSKAAQQEQQHQQQWHGEQQTGQNIFYGNPPAASDDFDNPFEDVANNH